MAKWRHGDMATWRHGDMAKWQNGDMAKWRHGKMAKWQNGKEAKWQNGKMAKWQNGKMAKRQRGKEVKVCDKDPEVGVEVGQKMNLMENSSDEAEVCKTFLVEDVLNYEADKAKETDVKQIGQDYSK